MNYIKFIKNPKHYNPDGSFIVHLSEINTKEELFRKLFKNLKLPDYFGFNWDALSDCLRDLHWIKEQGVVLVHDEVPLLNEEDFNKYIKTLIYSAEDWKEGEKHYLEVVFPISDEKLIKKHL